MDAGLKHNSVRNTWEPFFKIPVPGKGLITTANANYTDSKYRVLYKPGQNVNLTFAISKDQVTGKAFVLLYTSGINTDNYLSSLVIGLNTDKVSNNLFGWDPAQTTIRLKRMASMAQNVPYVTQYSAGADFVRSGSYMRNAKWQNTIVVKDGIRINYPYSQQRTCAVQPPYVTPFISGSSDMSININLAP